MSGRDPIADFFAFANAWDKPHKRGCAILAELQAELPQLQQQKPRELLPRVSAALATVPSPQLSAFLEAGWRHPSKDAEYVARLDILLTDLVDVLKESEELFGYLQKSFRLVQRAQPVSRPNPTDAPNRFSSSGNEDLRAKYASRMVDAPAAVSAPLGEDGDAESQTAAEGFQWDGVEIPVYEPPMDEAFMESETVRRRDERAWAAATTLSMLEADLDLKQRVVHALSKTPDTSAGQMQAYAVMWKLQPFVDNNLTERAAKMTA
mmetsp:Transcript_45311/g.75584  ORF Transcript_45311/g.75584 Transcript_45311/m.75584 type:complete len:264 (-) Transcript_45311:15-806(-)